MPLDYGHVVEDYITEHDTEGDVGDSANHWHGEGSDGAPLLESIAMAVVECVGEKQQGG